jgi:hypothetical protein
MNRRRFLVASAIALPLPAWAEPPLGRVRELSGAVFLNDYRVQRNTALQPGQTLSTGPDGEIWFTVGEDAFFLRPNSRLRLETARAASAVVDLLRLAAGAVGATFARGPARQLVTPTSTIGIRGTGVYAEAADAWTYACTCFGDTHIEAMPNGKPGRAVDVASKHHVARRIDLDGAILDMPFIRHTSDEIARLESLVGRPNPFRV